jgi:DNA-binding NtrC family response regulator
MNPQILLVDDEATVGQLLKVYFQKFGLDLATAMTVDQAKQVLDKDQFHLVILDLDLGGADGMELLGYIKGKFPKMPVVIFTGLNLDENFLKRTLAGRAEGFMRKTESLTALFKEVCRHLPSELQPPNAPA